MIIFHSSNPCTWESLSLFARTCQHGVGIGSDDAKKQQEKRKKEITGTLDDLGLDEVDIQTIATHIKENYIK